MIVLGARGVGMSHGHWTKLLSRSLGSETSNQKCPLSTFKTAQVDVDGNPWPLDASGNPITK